MANYSIDLTDNLNGSYAVTNVKRAATFSSSGTDLKAAFPDVASANTWLAVGDALQRALDYVLADKVKNG